MPSEKAVFLVYQHGPGRLCIAIQKMIALHWKASLFEECAPHLAPKGSLCWRAQKPPHRQNIIVQMQRLGSKLPCCWTPSLVLLTLSQLKIVELCNAGLHLSRPDHQVQPTSHLSFPGHQAHVDLSVNAMLLE